MAEERGSPIQKFSSLTKSPLFIRTIVILGIAGITLILFSSFIPSSNQKNTAEKSNNSYVNLTQYENELEQNLAEIICSINGAGTTKVLLTMESTVEQIYAADNNIAQNDSNNKKNSDSESKKDITSENKYITVELADGTEQTVLIKEIQPKVRGVLVVCSGGDNNVVKEKVIDAVTKVLDISSSKVSVVGLSQ